MLSADSTTPLEAIQALYQTEDDDSPSLSPTEALTWRFCPCAW